MVWTGAGTIKPYAERMIDEIRAIDPDNLIIVGTEFFSQGVDIAAADPILGETNIVYALHFYAATHMDGLRDRARTAIAAGLPLFVSEWGPVEANGDGLADPFSTEEWLALMREHDLSHTIWSVSDTFDSHSFLVRNAPSEGPFRDRQLTGTGEIARDIIDGWSTENAGIRPAEIGGDP